MLVGKSETRRHVPVECDPVTSNRFVHTEGGICYLLKYIHYLFSCFQLEKCVLMESYEVLKESCFVPYAPGKPHYLYQ